MLNILAVRNSQYRLTQIQNAMFVMAARQHEVEKCATAREINNTDVCHLDKAGEEATKTA